MATCCCLLPRIQADGTTILLGSRYSSLVPVSNTYAEFKCPANTTSRRNEEAARYLRGGSVAYRVRCSLGVSPSPPGFDPSQPLSDNLLLCLCRGTEITDDTTLSSIDATKTFTQSLMLLDLDPAKARLAIGILGPFLSAFAFLFIVRIVMSWYPKLPVGEFPYVIAYAPTEPLLIPTRRLIPPLGGVDVTPVVWFGLISFLNEILVGPQGILVLLSQQVS